MITIEGIQSQDAQAIWPLVQKWVADACEYSDGSLSVLNVLEQVQAQEQQLWVVRMATAPVAAMTTRVSIRPTGKRVLEVVTLGGVLMDYWLANIVALLKMFAEDQKCESVEAHGRRGWVRALKEFGWEERSVTVAMEIDNG